MSIVGWTCSFRLRSWTLVLVKDKVNSWSPAVILCRTAQGWLGSRVVSVLDSDAVGPGFKLQPDAVSNSLRQTVHAYHAFVHQAAKLAAALLTVARVTVGLAESNGSLPPGLWLTSPAGWLPRTGIGSGTLCSVIECGLPLPLFYRISRYWYWDFALTGCMLCYCSHWGRLARRSWFWCWV